MVVELVVSDFQIVQDAPPDGALRAPFGGAVFRRQLQQGLRLEGVARTDTRRLPFAHVAVVLGRETLQKRQGAVAQPFVARAAAVGELQYGHQVDSDDAGLECPEAFGKFVARSAGDVVRQ